MPETRSERLILVLGLLLLAGLVFVSVRERHRSSAAAAPARAAVSPPAVSARATDTQHVPATTSAAPAAAAPKPSVKPQPVRLSVAARNDTWLEIRAGSRTGKLLFSGVLAGGKRQTVSAKRIWVRFGGAANAAVALDGRSLPIPSGTYDAVFDRRGFHRSS